MTNPRNGKHRRPSPGLRKGTIAVGLETDSTIEQDEAKVVVETPDQAAPDVDETQDMDGADSADNAEGVRASEDSSSDETDDASDTEPPARKRRITWSHLVAFTVLPVLALSLAAAAFFAKWQGTSARMSEVASIESVAAAKDSTVALLSYQPDSVEKDLSAARDRLTGKFKDSYTQLVHDVVIPGAKKDRITAVATVPAAASVSATAQHAVVLAFIDQTVTIGTDAPTETSSTVRVALDKSGDRWLISSFDPV
jgi:Mce-associated membrane protein